MKLWLYFHLYVCFIYHPPEFSKLLAMLIPVVIAHVVLDL